MRFLPARGSVGISERCGLVRVDLGEKGVFCLKPYFLRSVSLLDPKTQSLKEHLIDELDYVMVPNEAWNKLVTWYGCIDGQQPVVRTVSTGELLSAWFRYLISAELRSCLFC